MSIGHVVNLWSESESVFRPHRPEWQEEAKCKGQLDMFFNESNLKLTANAKAMCMQCPVKKQCLAHALKHGEAGVWGGTTSVERGQHRNGKGR